MIQGPRTSNSPIDLPSCGCARPASSTIFISTPKTGRPCFALTPLCAVRVEAQMLRLQRRGRAERAHLGHSPALANLDAVAGERLDHRSAAPQSRRKAAGAEVEQRVPGRGEMRLEAEPNGRHAEAQRHPLGLEQLIEALPVEPRPGQYELRAVHRRGVGDAPAAWRETLALPGKPRRAPRSRSRRGARCR